MLKHNELYQENIELLTVQQTAELLKTTPKSLYNYLCKAGVKEGGIRKQFPKDIYVKLGRKTLFIKHKVIEWLMLGAQMQIIQQEQKEK